MAFTADKLLATCKSQNGTVGGYKYWNYFGQPGRAKEDWCCVFGCWALAESGRNIGCWASCGRIASDGGVQYGMAQAGFKKCSSLDEAGPGACIIINHHNDDYLIYDHFVIWMGTYSKNSKGELGIDVWNGNASNSVKASWYPVSHVQVIYMPNFDSAAKNGWVQESGVWHYYKDGALAKNEWHEGTGTNKGKWFYLGADGAPIRDQWLCYKGKYYHFGADAAAQSNVWVEGTGKFAGKYFFLGSDGTPLKSQAIKTDGKVYYVGADGAAVTNAAIARESDHMVYWFGEDGALLPNAAVTFKTDEHGVMTYARTEV